jgi:hypothetical protein
MCRNKGVAVCVVCLPLSCNTSCTTGCLTSGDLVLKLRIFQRDNNSVFVMWLLLVYRYVCTMYMITLIGISMCVQCTLSLLLVYRYVCTMYIITVIGISICVYNVHYHCYWYIDMCVQCTYHYYWYIDMCVQCTLSLIGISICVYNVHYHLQNALCVCSAGVFWC